jgi:DNA-binding CsgD family transcriptional regulator
MQDSDSSPGRLNLSERAIMEYYAQGLGDREIAVRFRVSRREISFIRRHAVTKLAARISSAHPFQIREVMLP